MSEPILKKLDELFIPRLTPNEFIKNITIGNLLNPGENYMSEMMKVDVLVKNKVSGADRKIHAVAKCIIEVDKDFHLMLFVKEMSFYQEIVSAIQTFLKKMGSNPAEYFAEFYGGRLNLTGDSSKPDRDALLLLKNLHTNGFQNLDRHEGFDLAQAQMVLKDLSHLHATCVAMKLLDPELFEEKIKKNCHVKSPPSPTSPDGSNLGFTRDLFVDILKEDEECLPAIPAFERMLEKQWEIGFDDFFNGKQREPFATLALIDIWMNNTMQELDSKGRVVQNKFIDFQVYCYNSPAKDLLFLLQTSVKLPVLRANLDGLMKHYHDNFTKVLGELGCDLAAFSYDNFLEEVKAVIPSLLVHASFMLLVVIYGKKGEAVNAQDAHKMKRNDIDPRAREKFRFFVLEAYKRGWLGN